LLKSLKDVPYTFCPGAGGNLYTGFGGKDIVKRIKITVFIIYIEFVLT